MRRTLLLLAIPAAFGLGVLVGGALTDESPGADPDRPTYVVAARPGSAPDAGSLLLDVEDQDAIDELPADVIDRLDLDGTIEQLDEVLRLPVDVTVLVRDDADQAYYDPEAKEIVLSPSLVADTVDTMRDTYQDELDADIAAASSVQFTLLHEVGHALVDVLELPTTGLEETAVDQFAAVALLDLLDDPIAVLEASDLFDALSVTPEEADYYDEHALDQQRFFHLRCLVYGTDPFEYSDELEGLDLDEGRADLCIDDSRRVRDAWQALLAPYVELD